MTTPAEIDAILHLNQASLTTLQRAIDLQQNRFGLVLVRCNYQRLQSIVLQSLQAALPHLQVLELDQTVPSLLVALHIYHRLQSAGSPPPTAVMVTGLDTLTNLEQILNDANIARDEFRKRCPFPLVLWISDRVLHTLNRHAQDLKNLAPPTIRVELPTESILTDLHHNADSLFNRSLSFNSQRFPAHPQELRHGLSPIPYELDYALADLQKQGIALDADLQASLDFLRGREAHSRLEMDTARELYERSLAHWQQQTASPPAPESDTPEDCYPNRTAVLLFYLGNWWRSYAILQRATYEPSLRQARRYFADCMAIARQQNTEQRVAHLIPALAEVLQKLGDWEALDTLAQEGVSLHTHDPVRLARDYGYLAETALQRQDWALAQTQAQHALAELDQADQIPTPSEELADALLLARRFHRGWYRFLLGEAEMHLIDPKRAIAHLEAARNQTDPDIDLILHLRILRELTHHYYDQGQYREAFEVKQARRQVEYRYNLRAFVGAGIVQPHYLNATPNAEAILAAEIIASGRQPDIQNLLHRLSDPQRQIIIIHGQSGVGKSSIIEAGLLPALRRFTPEGRRTLPIVLKTYTAWQETIQVELERVIAEDRSQESGVRIQNSKFKIQNSKFKIQTSSPHLPISPSPPLSSLLHTLTAAPNFIVIIFDQFEEFFVDATELAQRRQFYDFMQTCLNVAYVKLVLSLREDYLHYLLEAERLVDLSGAGDDILSKDVRYPLRNFSPEGATAVIEQLTEKAQFFLEPDLIAAFVADLAEETGEVRPIELQVVGAELQRQEIQTLSAYRALGEQPKQRLVQTFLNAVVEDCGPPNETVANLVLFLLTADNGLRPLKTRRELEEELDLLGVPTTPAQMDLVLEILTGSGLVFVVPETPADRYQLVHDYLVDFIRQQQTGGLLRELEAARSQPESLRQLR